METVVFAGLCENIISVPTGLTEAICALNNQAKINLQFVIPPEGAEEFLERYQKFFKNYIGANTEFKFQILEENFAEKIFKNCSFEI